MDMDDLFYESELDSSILNDSSAPSSKDTTPDKQKSKLKTKQFKQYKESEDEEKIRMMTESFDDKLSDVEEKIEDLKGEKEECKGKLDKVEEGKNEMDKQYYRKQLERIEGEIKFAKNEKTFIKFWQNKFNRAKKQKVLDEFEKEYKKIYLSNVGDKRVYEGIYEEGYNSRNYKKLKVDDFDYKNSTHAEFPKLVHLDGHKITLEVKDQNTRDTLYIDKGEIVGDEKLFITSCVNSLKEEIKNYIERPLNNGDDNCIQGPLNLDGLAGSGKSCSLKIVLSQLKNELEDYTFLYFRGNYCADDVKFINNLEKFLREKFESKQLHSHKVVLVLDQLDGEGTDTQTVRDRFVQTRIITGVYGWSVVCGSSNMKLRDIPASNHKSFGNNNIFQVQNISLNWSLEEKTDRDIFIDNLIVGDNKDKSEVLNSLLNITGGLMLPVKKLWRNLNDENLSLMINVCKDEKLNKDEKEQTILEVCNFGLKEGEGVDIFIKNNEKWKNVHKFPYLICHTLSVDEDYSNLKYENINFINEDDVDCRIGNLNGSSFSFHSLYIKTFASIALRHIKLSFVGEDKIGKFILKLQQGSANPSVKGFFIENFLLSEKNTILNELIKEVIKKPDLKLSGDTLQYFHGGKQIGKTPALLIWNGNETIHHLFPVEYNCPHIDSAHLLILDSILYVVVLQISLQTPQDKIVSKGGLPWIEEGREDGFKMWGNFVEEKLGNKFRQIKYFYVFVSPLGVTNKLKVTSESVTNFYNECEVEVVGYPLMKAFQKLPNSEEYKLLLEKLLGDHKSGNQIFKFNFEHEPKITKLELQKRLHEFQKIPDKKKIDQFVGSYGNCTNVTKGILGNLLQLKGLDKSSIPKIGENKCCFVNLFNVNKSSTTSMKKK